MRVASPHVPTQLPPHITVSDASPPSAPQANELHNLSHSPFAATSPSLSPRGPAPTCNPSSRSLSLATSLVTGMPVHREMTAAMSASVTVLRTSRCDPPPPPPPSASADRALSSAASVSAYCVRSRVSMPAAAAAPAAGPLYSPLSMGPLPPPPYSSSSSSSAPLASTSPTAIRQRVGGVARKVRWQRMLVEFSMCEDAVC